MSMPENSREVSMDDIILSIVEAQDYGYISHDMSDKDFAEAVNNILNYEVSSSSSP